MFARVIPFVLFGLAAASPAFADDWTVIKLHGPVQSLAADATWSNQHWADLKRGDIVPGDTPVRTLTDGHVDLQRGAEVVSLGAMTRIRIHDKSDVRYTTVHQDFGSVEVEAQVENFVHFSVETPYLAAVVKGTHFIVNSSNASGASVTVDRGMVGVQSKVTQRSTTVTVGQTASVAPRADMTVSGTGPLPAIVGDGGPVLPGADDEMPAAGTLSLRGPMAASAASLPATAVADAGSGGLTGTAAPAVRDAPLNPGVVWIGLLIGIMVGGVALLFRRALH